MQAGLETAFGLFLFTPVKTGDGQPIPGTGLVPDIAQILPPDKERQYLADPYLSLGGSAPAAGARGRPRARRPAISARRLTSAPEVST